MILRSLNVSGWRCFVTSLEVGPFIEGLNVVHAPNATGKSTLFEALQRGLLDGHRTAAREIKDVQPWGRSLAPTVVVEFCHGGVDYRLTKRFLKEASSRLERRENGRFNPLKDSDEADKMVQMMLTRNAPGRGLSQVKNWGLAQVLWAPQGELALPSLSGNVIADVRSSLGTQAMGSGSGPLEEKIEQKWLQFFTPTGRLKSGQDAPELVMIEERIEKAQSERKIALSRQEEFDAAARKVSELRLRRETAKASAERTEKALGEARERAASCEVLRAEEKQREERLGRTGAEHNVIEQRVKAIGSAREEFSKARKMLVECEASLPAKEKEAIDREREYSEAQRALEEVRKGRKEVQDAGETADEARRFLAARESLDALEKTIGDITKAQAHLEACVKERASIAAPDAKALWAIGGIIKERDEARLHLEAAMITLEVVPEREGLLEVIEGEAKGTLQLNSGTPALIKGSPEVVVELPGVARLRAWGPAGSVEQYRDALAAAGRKLEEMTTPYGTSDIEKLRALSGEMERRKREVSLAAAELNTLLKGGSLEAVGQKRSAAAATVAKILETHPEWKANPPDASALRESAGEREKLFLEEIDLGEKRRDKAQSDLTTAMREKNETASLLETTKKSIEAISARLAELTGDGKSDDERGAELKQSLLAWDAARESLDETKKKIAALGADPSLEVGRLEEQLKADSEVAKQVFWEESREEGRLSQLASQGTYSALALVEEELSGLEERVEDERLRVGAIELVHEVVAQCREEALAEVAAPVETAATHMLERIAGKSLGRLSLSDGFEPGHVVPPASGEEVSIEENVSGGEKEQIYLATRLALAGVLAREERQMVVLDDVLAFTDAQRLARILRILEEAAGRLQIIILTCHPERYESLQGAEFIDLEAAVGGEGE